MRIIVSLVAAVLAIVGIGPVQRAVQNAAAQGQSSPAREVPAIVTSRL